MVELKPQITEYLTTWTEWSSCSPYCKRSRFRVCSGEFKCYDEQTNGELVLCTGNGWFYLFLTHYLWLITNKSSFQPITKITVKLNTNRAKLEKNVSKTWQAKNWSVVKASNSVTIIQLMWTSNSKVVFPRVISGHGCMKSRAETLAQQMKKALLKDHFAPPIK